MALTVTVRSGDSESGPSLVLDAPRIVVGRGESCEIRLPDQSVSQRHASIRQRGADYILMDEGSTNGTFVGRVRLPVGAPRLLVSGERVRVGRVWLRVEIGPGVPAPNPSLATRELALGLVASAMRSEGQAADVVVRVVAGRDEGASIVLAEPDRAYVLGRAEDADLPLDDEDCSRRHAKVIRRADAVWVEDLDSKNGTRIDATQVMPGKAKKWPTGTRLFVGSTELELADPVAEVLAQLDAADDERMNPNEDVEHDAESQRSPDPAPIAPVVRRPATVAAPRGWNRVDVGVALLALVVLGVSLAALKMLFGD